MLCQIDRLCESLDSGTDGDVSTAVAQLLARGTRQAASLEGWKKLIATLSACGYTGNASWPFGPLDNARRQEVRAQLSRLRHVLQSQPPTGDLLRTVGIDAEVQYRLVTECHRAPTKLRRYDYLVAGACFVSIAALVANIYLNLQFE
eukprot:GGOE01006284.1.p1 GENE.GGOE01006284.1~~GGOE01006284.1.p1  ORF type:complete len:147 (-),score=38.42 GGOE01006284.1:527-967(-)